MSILKALGIAIAWLTGIFKSVKDDAAKIAVVITEGIQAGLKSGVFTNLADILDAAFHTELGATAVSFLNTNIPKILATELAIEGLPDNPTDADETAFANRLAEAITGKDLMGKSKLWTTLAVQIKHIIETQVNGKEPVTYASAVADIEQAFNDYKADLAAQALPAADAPAPAAEVPAAETQDDLQTKSEQTEQTDQTEQVQ